MDRNIAQPIMPREIDLKIPLWYVVSDKNIDEFHERLTKEHGDENTNGRINVRRN